MRLKCCVVDLTESNKTDLFNQHDLPHLQQITTWFKPVLIDVTRFQTTQNSTFEFFQVLSFQISHRPP